MSAPAVNPAPTTPNLVTQSAFFIPNDVDLPRFKYLEGDERDPIHNRMQKHRFYGKRIQLRSINGKTGQPVVMGVSHRRKQDTAWLGVPRLSPSDEMLMHRHGYAIGVPGESYVSAEDGFEVDCGTEDGLYLWEWLQFAEQIITDTDSYDPEKPHEGADKELYVLIPADEQSKITQTFVDRKYAGDWLFTQTPRDWYDIARLLGAGMDGSKQLDVFNYLMDVAQKSPERLLAIQNDNQKDAKLLVKRLLDRGILRESNGVISYNNVSLGTSEEQVLHYVMQEANAVIVKYLRNELGVDAGMGGQPVVAQYANYGNTVSEEAILKQASAPSSTLNMTRPNAAPAPAPLPAGDQLQNDDLGDDYMPDEDEQNETAGSTASTTTATATVVPPVVVPPVVVPPTTTAARPAPGRPKNNP